MNRARVRIWLLNGLNSAVAVVLLLYALEKWSATRGLVPDGFLLLLVFAVFLLIPPVLVAVFFLGRGAAAARTRRQKLHARASVVFLCLGWLATALPASFWGVILLGATEPWPLSLRQGPDTDRAREGAKRLFGFAPDGVMTSLYFYSFNVRDASYFVHFRYSHPVTIERIVRSRDLVQVRVEARHDTRFSLRASANHLSWWEPEKIHAADALYVDRPTAEKVSGTRPWRSSIGEARTLWVESKTGTAYYRELEF